MKKLVLSLGLAALALSVSAQKAGISPKAFYDDFADADTSTKQTADEYTMLTNKIKWDDAIGTSGAPVPTEKAYMGIFWGEATGKVNNFVASKQRDGKGSVKYIISQDTGKYDPIYLGFGAYAEPTKKPFTLDLSKNSTVSFTFKNSGAIVVRLALQLQDIDDTTLVYIDSVNAPGALYYQNQLGFVQGKSKAVAPGATVNFSYDLSKAVVGAQPDNKVLPNAKFDYTKVKAVLLTVYQDANTGATKYLPIALKNYPVEFSNFKLGDGSTIVTGLNDSPISSSSSDEIVSAYDMLGNFVGTGKIKELGLESGKVYIVKSSSQTRKIVMAK